MPDIVRHGVTLDEALQEAAAISPITRAILVTYELWHPAIVTPLRFVNDRADLLATLEDDAPRNAAEQVEFMAAYPITFERPEESDAAGTPRLKLARPDVSGLWVELANSVRDSGGTWTIIEREFASDNTSAPVKRPPLTLEIEASSVAGPDLAITARFDEDNATAVPTIHYTRRKYPGLQR